MARRAASMIDGGSGRGVAHGGSGAYGRLRAHCEATGERPRQVLAAVASGSMTLTGVNDLVRREVELQNRLLAPSALSLDQLIDALFPDADDDYLALRDAASVARPGIASAAELYEYLRNQITQPEMPAQGDFVRVMSLHKSKGLTSKVVVVAGTVEGLIPNVDAGALPAEQGRVLEEQRRLFCVAITRCTEVLVISSALTITLREAMAMGRKSHGVAAQSLVASWPSLAPLHRRAWWGRRGPGVCSEPDHVQTAVARKQPMARFAAAQPLARSPGDGALRQQSQRVSFCSTGPPGGIRTPDLLIRSQSL